MIESLILSRMIDKLNYNYLSESFFSNNYMNVKKFFRSGKKSLNRINIFNNQLNNSNFDILKAFYTTREVIYSSKFGRKVIPKYVLTYSKKFNFIESFIYAESFFYNQRFRHSTLFELI